MASGDTVVRVIRQIPPGASAALLDGRAGGSTPAENVVVVDFPADSDAYMDYLCELLGNYDSGGLDWDLPWPLWQLAATHLLVVALPEEFLYRGFVQQRLNRVLTRRVTILGTKVGLAVLITAALFALGHFLTDMRVDRLATFFPALVFGWLKERRGSIVGPVLFHASANVFSDILTEGYFG